MAWFESTLIPLGSALFALGAAFYARLQAKEAHGSRIAAEQQVAVARGQAEIAREQVILSRRADQRLELITLRELEANLKLISKLSFGVWCAFPANPITREAVAEIERLMDQVRNHPAAMGDAFRAAREEGFRGALDLLRRLHDFHAPDPALPRHAQLGGLEREGMRALRPLNELVSTVMQRAIDHERELAPH